MTTTTVLPWGGGELSSLDPQDGNCLEYTTDSSRWDTTVSRCAIQMDSGTDGAKSPTWAAASDFWFNAVYCPGTDNTNVLLFLNGSTVVAKCDLSGSHISIYTLQSSVMTFVGTLNTIAAVRNTIGFRVVAGASGRVEAYLANGLIFTVTGLDHTDFSGVTQVHPRGPPGGGVVPHYWSQFICDSISHVGDKLVTVAIDTVSAVNADWSGPVTNINEIILNDANNVTSSAAAQTSTYYKSGFSLGTYNILAVFIGVRAQLTAGSSTNLQVALRTNGSNYFSSTIALDSGYQACCASWTLNPATGTAWLASQAAVVEGGMKSIA